MKRHKWVKDWNGKGCSICGSRINTKQGFKFIEVDKYGIAEPKTFYPRCLYTDSKEQK